VKPRQFLACVFRGELAWGWAAARIASIIPRPPDNDGPTGRQPPNSRSEYSGQKGDRLALLVDADAPALCAGARIYFLQAAPMSRCAYTGWKT
jgi:hypothetical protein